MKGIVERLHDNRQIQIARSILESNNYVVTKSMREADEEVTTEYNSKVENILNHQLSSYETGVKVLGIKKISETPETVTLKVEYDVNVQIPIVDPETQETYTEDEVEYRVRTITFERDELSESTINEDINEPQYCVIKPDGTYAGAPCYSEEEAREMRNQEEGRVIYKLVKLEDNTEVYSYVFTTPNDMANEDLSSSIADIINRAGAENRGVKKSAGKYHISFTCPGEYLRDVLDSIEGSGLFSSWVED